MINESCALPQTIDEVIAQLDQVIECCVREGDRLGYFAMLYRDVTVCVREGIATGRFEDGARMERLDVIFASRYLQALYDYRDGRQPSASWFVAFEAAHHWPPIIMQHLLLGMSAHINLDLGIAAAQTAPGDQLPGLERDFMEITNLIDDMIHGVEKRIEKVSPWFRLIDRVGGRTNEQICGFAIEQARNLAWLTAQALASVTGEELSQKIQETDQIVALLGHVILSPIGILTRLGLFIIRLRERRRVPQAIQILKLG